MKFLTIALENFSSYKGEQRIELATSPSSPIILIHGENQLGKTSMFHAIKWCLYGRVRANDQQEIAPTDFANWDMRDTGSEFTMSVTLELEDDRRVVPETLTLKRWINCVRDEANPQSVKISDSGASLLSSATGVIAREDIPDVINSILHEEISDLFLFDGEALSALVLKLKSASGNTTIRDSIEKALGMTAFSTLLSDLDEIRTGVDKEYKASMATQSKAKKLIDELGTVEDELKTLRKNQADVEQMLETAIALRDELKPTIMANASLREKQEYREQVRIVIRQNEELVRTSRKQLQILLSEKFWLPCSGKIRRRHDEVQSQQEQSSREFKQEVIDSQREADIARSLETNTCVVCEQALGEVAHKHLSAMNERVKNQMESSLRHSARNQELVLIQKDLSYLLDSSSSRDLVAKLDADMRLAELEIERRRRELRDLDAVLSGTGSEFEDTENRYNQAIANIERAENAIPALKEKIDLKVSEQRNKEAKLKEVEGTELSDPLKLKLEAIDELITIYSSAIDQFRDLMRQRVEAEASAIFKRLTTRAGYEGLRINRQYFLDIIDSQDRVILRRSAGAEQVVALSLIGALVKCSVRQAPVVLDTPLGRLDTKHGLNIYKWFPEMADQLVLFVTSREFSDDVDRPVIGNSLGREYFMEELSPSHTEIRRRKNV